MDGNCAEENEGMIVHPLYFVPEGSLAEFPSTLEKLFKEDDIRHLGRNGWCSKRVPACVLRVYPELMPSTYGMPLSRQQSVIPSLEPLTPYDIACVAAFHKKCGMAPLFQGRVRTESEVEGYTSHLHTSPLTVIASFDSTGALRLSKGYASQTGEDLGLLLGERIILR